MGFLYEQINDTDSEDIVEILVNLDNKEKTTGFKRQELLNWSRGKYVIFIDDDDWISNWYICELLRAAESGADCFSINGIYTEGEGKEERKRVKWEISKDHPNENTVKNGKEFFLRRTNHITGVKREIAIAAGFPDKSNAEDKHYSDGLILTTEHKIEIPMYHYRCSINEREY